MIEMCDGFEPACTADSRQHRFGHAFGNAPSYLDMGKILRTLKIDSTEYEFLDIPCSVFFLFGFLDLFTEKLA